MKSDGKRLRFLATAWLRTTFSGFKAIAMGASLVETFSDDQPIKGNGWLKVDPPSSRSRGTTARQEEEGKRKVGSKN